MWISAREACVKPHLRTRSDIKVFFTTAMNTDHMKIHCTSQTFIEFILFPTSVVNLHFQC